MATRNEDCCAVYVHGEFKVQFKVIFFFGGEQNPFRVFQIQTVLSVPQVKEFGCRSFSLLFDDIETEMCPADKQAFSSFAHAQVAITNAVYQHLGEPETFLFCPTGEVTKNCCYKNKPFMQSH